MPWYPSDLAGEGCCEIVVTAPSFEWLAGFTKKLVDERFVACGQIIREIRSIYWWDGAVRHGTEARVALHTRRTLVPEIVALTEELHPYETPCVVVTPLVGGSPAYLDWVEEETREPAQPR
ncbi:divalent-cation tolerance protein CutA [Actinophytocola xanthii]|uniref:Divalent-cation tolerance protein CutA n=1 Tax=Actinophytocola xanthii TaxID=1912961 RepID=A0A1Q8CDW0_9PSEU|nr:divalent-cation tolerance protein CutA [Actinophytocola xanthii]